ncbi:MAG: hypothetical protein IJD91_00680 [Clostridia bacterium]|nr:hypothetical protein [Clostridia bacterium]
MSINKIMESTSIKELVCAIEEFHDKNLIHPDSVECLELQQAVSESDKDIFCILYSYIWACEEGYEIVEALREFYLNCGAFDEADNESTTQITNEEFETVLQECEEKCGTKSCIEYKHKLQTAEMDGVKDSMYGIVSFRPGTVNILLPRIHNSEDKMQYISKIIGDALLEVIQKKIKIQTIKKLMNKLIPETRKSKKDTEDLFVDYFYEVIKYKERKPGIYTKFDSHMHQVIILEFYKQIIKCYNRYIAEDFTDIDGEPEIECLKGLNFENRMCEGCAHYYDCYDEEDLVELERNFSKSLAEMAGYENEDAFWDSMI